MKKHKQTIESIELETRESEPNTSLSYLIISLIPKQLDNKHL
jgi:hypothetical protein